MALENKLDNRLDLFNECCISIITQHMLYFTDFIKDDQVKYLFGWSMVLVLLIMVFVNFVVIF